MKNNLIFLILISISFSQQYEDVVILKNGGEIHGIIIEQKLNEYIKIKSGKNIFVFQMDEIDIIKKELITEFNDGKYDPFTGEKIKKTDSEHFDKNHSIGIGIFNNKSFNFLQYTYDIKLSKNTSIFGLLGYGNLLGLGLSWQSNYNENGFMIGWSGGVDIERKSFGSFAISYQWRLGNNSNYLSLGLLNYAYEATYYYSFNSYTEIETMILPIISYDYRF